MALATSAGGAGLVARLGPVDRPGARASHVAPTRTSGGLAIIAATALGWATAVALGAAASWPSGPALWVALAGAAVAGLLGAVDDLHHLSARAKLLVMVPLAAACVWAAGGAGVVFIGLPSLLLQAATSPAWANGLPVPVLTGLIWLGAGLLTFWLLAAVNAVNFMDGANGLAAGSLAIALAAAAASAWVSGLPGVAALAGVAACANLGFLPWNLAGRLFQGDAGALFSALLFALVCLPAALPEPLFGPTCLLPLLVDTGLTLVRRAHGRRALAQAHREHLYQRWLQVTGRSHLALAWRVWALVAACSLLAVAEARLSLSSQVGVTAAAAGLLCAAWAWQSRRLDARP